MLKRYILIALFLLTGSAFAQYLSYNDWISLIKIADNKAGVKKYLINKGLEYFDEGVKNDVIYITYTKTIGRDQYLVSRHIIRLKGQRLSPKCRLRLRGGIITKKLRMLTALYLLETVQNRAEA